MDKHLTEEEEDALRELLWHDANDGAVADFINNRLDALTDYGDDDDGCFLPIGKPGYEKQYSVYASLAEKGHLCSRKTASGLHVFEGLTPDGRCYFLTKRQQRKEKWSDRRFAIGMSILSFALSVATARILDLIRQ